MTMMHTTSRLPFGAITVHRVVSFGNRMLSEIRAWNDVRRTAAALRALTPAQLEDIGLVPADIDIVARRGRR